MPDAGFHYEACSHASGLYHTRAGVNRSPILHVNTARNTFQPRFTSAQPTRRVRRAVREHCVHGGERGEDRVHEHVTADILTRAWPVTMQPLHTSEARNRCKDDHQNLEGRTESAQVKMLQEVVR
jgi:hypothetical protein